MLDPAILCTVHVCLLECACILTTTSLGIQRIRALLEQSTGNVSVDRKSKDRQAVFRGTFESLGQGPRAQPVALFPEGTGLHGATYPLEYTKWAKENSDSAAKEALVIAPSSIDYMSKSKYGSYVIMEFGRPIEMDPYIERFLGEDEGSPHAAVKRLTRAIEAQLFELTINAVDWYNIGEPLRDTVYAARMAQDLLLEGEKTLNRDEYVHTSQTIPLLFSAIATSVVFKSFQVSPQPEPFDSRGRRKVMDGYLRALSRLGR
ncbi:hypothetical protein BV25DRAFT_1843336 [Artomyces pyxidatus]|uniref:Uncharacterized protein n=1 Tax=Artomyces pyxidatus TaxID=48021 RepID=A0ACB8SF78_9AGAM|nr:hypothetical protein BV25DRAFT_1843336 [Artomyces pyxidatus]